VKGAEVIVLDGVRSYGGSVLSGRHLRPGRAGFMPRKLNYAYR
jgi:hypothetical protein